MDKGYKELTLEKLQTPEGIRDLNLMLRALFDLVVGDGETVKIYSGYGSPLNVVVASIGSIYMRLDGGANTSIYVKESGLNTAAGWVAK